MRNQKTYSAQNVFEGLTKTFHQYLEAQYHIWDESLIEERRALLETTGTTFQEPQLEATPFYATGKTYNELSIPAEAKAILTLAAKRPNVGIYPEPYMHQAHSLEAFLGKNEEIIVATGTGSGKTESFLMPILGSLAVESQTRPQSWKTPGVRALLLYPMNALVNDQLGRLRRLFGDTAIGNYLKGGRSGYCTFGMYTSRTAYPGAPSPSKDRDRISKVLEKLYKVPPEVRSRLMQEGKWPAKDIEGFQNRSFKTGPEDYELFTRHEMQAAAPDLLVTNYSMLEYMMLRPIEKGIFEQTAKWLAKDDFNRFIVVLDEAHMYRGSGGAEVAYLLRRLHSRLGIGRDRIQYVLTSASLGSGAEAQRRIKLFAADLTGLTDPRKVFTLITGTIDKKRGEMIATQHEGDVLAKYNFSLLHKAFSSFDNARAGVEALFKHLGRSVAAPVTDESGLRGFVYDWLGGFGPAALAANLITTNPHPLGEIAKRVFPDNDVPQNALESLLALMSFARLQSTNRVFAPVRSHLFFRGLPGLFVCTNRNCSYRNKSAIPNKLGRLFSSPQLRCDCGARTYELLTHRDCGAAFIRGYLANEDGDFLWHEKSNGLWSDLNLLEAHFLVEADRKSTDGEGAMVWLHIASGLLSPHEPPKEKLNEYLPILRPDSVINEKGHALLTFNQKCPVCVRKWQGASKIMDLATKGEAPFAHLVREQVALQPMTQVVSEQAPNGGRKSLLFSDGRQKAARLARDIPREIEQDVFRQLLFMAANSLTKINHEPILSHWIYVAFLDVLVRTGLQLLDGDDRHALTADVRAYKKWHNEDLAGAIREFGSQPPPGFRALLHRQLGSRFYSAYALTLGYLRPTVRAERMIVAECASLPKEQLLPLIPVWLQGFADDFSFDPRESMGIRIKAAGHQVTSGLSPINGFSKRQKDFLALRLNNLDQLVNSFANNLCDRDPAGAYFLEPKRVALELALNITWYQCNSCTAVSPVNWWGHCPNCLAPNVIPVQPGATTYLRARKGFWRDPVVNAVEGHERPLNLTVEEHTAQLSYRDPDELSPTTEEFERRFKDILVSTDDTSIDVLSSTTTMEVGIDIGSLVAVGLRNVPPMRQNYQQRAGRTGRRGAAISTVITYAQNSPHDNCYFEDPKSIIAGEPVLPNVDTKNAKIIERHVRAQFVQSFFHAKVKGSGSQDIFSMLGNTWDFFTGNGEFSFQALSNWLMSEHATTCYESIKAWLPEAFEKLPIQVAREFLHGLELASPPSPDVLEQSDEYLIEFLFSHGFLPSYAFPRDLCALQIEQRAPNRRVQIVQRPQQGLNIALSEYAPGRFVVVNKKTYRIGTVASGGTSVVENRAERLFAGKRVYVHCPVCMFTAGFIQGATNNTECPHCRQVTLSAVTVIQPEIVYPEAGTEINEYDDEQVFSQSTGAQLPLTESASPHNWHPFLNKSKLAYVQDQSLVMVNKGTCSDYGEGFLICRQCGKSSIDGKPLGLHRRDYLINARRGAAPPSQMCNGEFEWVYLGYSFASDILLFRVPINLPFRFNAAIKRSRQPLADAFQSLCDALVIAISRTLDIDIREINSGYRFVPSDTDQYADIFIYDTLSGGAGYATEAGAVFDRVFQSVEELLTTCSCPSSCDKCLRHYGNRFNHESLDRHLALDIARFIKAGTFPPLFSKEQQTKELAPLINLLTLAGWTAKSGKVAPIVATRGGRTLELHAYPSLIEPSAAGYASSASAYAFSPYELSRDLPGAFAEIA